MSVAFMRDAQGDPINVAHIVRIKLWDRGPAAPRGGRYAVDADLTNNMQVRLAETDDLDAAEIKRDEVFNLADKGSAW